MSGLRPTGKIENGDFGNGNHMFGLTLNTKTDWVVCGYVVKYQHVWEDREKPRKTARFFNKKEAEQYVEWVSKFPHYKDFDIWVEPEYKKVKKVIRDDEYNVFR